MKNFPKENWSCIAATHPLISGNFVDFVLLSLLAEYEVSYITFNSQTEVGIGIQVEHVMGRKNLL